MEAGKSGPCRNPTGRQAARRGCLRMETDMDGKPSSEPPGIPVKASCLLTLLALTAGLGQTVLSATALDDATMRERVAPAIVLILLEDSYGSGFVLNGQGHIVTNHHVVAGDGRILARQGNQQALANLVWSSERLDLAVLRIRDGGLEGARPLPLAVSPPSPLLDVIAVGFPGAANAVTAASAPSYNEGNVGRVVQGTWGQGRLRIVQHSADINPGNSGGPLIDVCGRIVGVNTGGAGVAVSLAPGGPRIDSPSGLFWASFIGELAEQLDALSIPYSSAADDCEAAPASPAASSQGIMLLAVALAILALLFAFASFRRTVALAAARVRESASRRGTVRQSRHQTAAAPSPVSPPSRARRIRIGRGRNMDVALPSRKASRLHAELEVADTGELVLKDCGSTNGTRIHRNGRWRRISRDRVQLGERVRFGDYETTVAELLRLAGASSDEPGVEEKRRPAADDRPAGPVRRNPGTGEVMRDGEQGNNGAGGT